MSQTLIFLQRINQLEICDQHTILWLKIWTFYRHYYTYRIKHFLKSRFRITRKSWRNVSLLLINNWIVFVATIVRFKTVYKREEQEGLIKICVRYLLFLYFVWKVSWSGKKKSHFVGGIYLRRECLGFIVKFIRCQ